MNELHVAMLASALAVAFLVAAAIGRRAGDAPRDLRLMLGTGVACGGAALLLLSIWKAA